MSYLLAVTLAVLVLLWLNRNELLKIIKDRDEVISANTRAISEIEGQSNFLLATIENNQTKLIQLEAELGKERERNNIVVSQKKSSETRLGQISEQIVPFLENFKHDPKNTRFLGSPIDMVAFDFDDAAIYFIEIKTGGAKESKRQKIIKNAIKMGRVYYEELRINEKGISIKQAENIE